MKATLRTFIILITVISVTVSCKKDEISHIEKINSEIFDLMEVVYLWKDYMPRNVDPGDYSDPAEFMEDLRYTQYDHWSTVMTARDFNDYFVSGESIGHGFMVGLDADENFRIAFVYRNTEPDEKGVKRGWIMKKVNGTTVTTSNFVELMGEYKVGVSNDFTFIDENGLTVNLTLTKDVMELTPVLHSEVIELGPDKIGYMVFQDFIDAANNEMDEVFDTFSNAGINELIIDMRYNGGGSVAVAEHLAGWLIGKDFGGEPFTYYEVNEILSEEPYNLDTMYTVPVRANGLSLNRIFFIGTANTASASELIINGVRPFIPALLAGSTTHGKPVGMYSIPIPQNTNDYEYMALPVCFKYSNKNHEGEFYNGIPADLPADDDLSKDFGNPDEASLKAILDYIATGSVAGKSTKSTGMFPARMMIRKESLGQFLRAI